MPSNVLAAIRNSRRVSLPAGDAEGADQQPNDPVRSAESTPGHGRALGSLKSLVSGELLPSGDRSNSSRGKKFSRMLVQQLLPDEERTKRVEAEAEVEPDIPKSKGFYRSVSGTLRDTGTGTAIRGVSLFKLCVRRAQHGMMPVISESFLGGVYRALDRSGPFGQSRGHWNVSNVAVVEAENKGAEDEFEDEDKDTEGAVAELYYGDVYHTFLDAKLSTQLKILAAAYIICFFSFAVLWLLIEKPCGLQLKGSFISAYLLSLETMMTIGYGVPDPYMSGCWQGAIVLTTQTLLQLLMSACLIGVIFQRISAPQSRACTILFSKQAVIRCIDGAHYLMFRICDLRVQHALIESHVRLYCVHNHPVRGCEMMPMRLEHPDDEQGAPLLLTLPYIVVHRIDAWSPLAPYLTQQHVARRKSHLAARTLYKWQEQTSHGMDILQRAGRQRDTLHLRTMAWPGTQQRQVDCETGNRTSCICPYCGESFGTAPMLQIHCKYNAANDEASGLPEDTRHKPMPDEELHDICHMDPTREEIWNHLSKGYFEVVAIVEGIEPTTSATLQARHSFMIKSGETGNVVWDMDFAPCCRVPERHGDGLSIDLEQFHKLRRLDPEDSSCKSWH